MSRRRRGDSEQRRKEYRMHGQNPLEEVVGRPSGLDNPVPLLKQVYAYFVPDGSLKRFRQRLYVLDYGMRARTVEGTIERIAALADPVRRALYFYVAHAPGAVSRDQAARGVRIARPLAAFHLDKLVHQGLLEASYRRLTKRRGPGAGRPAKLYRRSGLQVDVSLPPRDYELAARLFASALAAGAPAGTRARVRRTARAFGAGLGQEARRRAGKRASRKTLLHQLDAVLQEHGYEPFRAPDGAIRLHNCPFDSLARDYRPLMCGMNQTLLAGVMRGLGLSRYTAVLDPQPRMCCVALKQA
jgi:predicted ArsR family transcriptional regulator